MLGTNGRRGAISNPAAAGERPISKRRGRPWVLPLHKELPTGETSTRRRLARQGSSPTKGRVPLSECRPLTWRRSRFSFALLPVPSNGQKRRHVQNGLTSSKARAPARVVRPLLQTPQRLLESRS